MNELVDCVRVNWCACLCHSGKAKHIGPCSCEWKSQPDGHYETINQTKTKENE